MGDARPGGWRWLYAVPMTGVALLPVGGNAAMLGVMLLIGSAWCAGLMRREGRGAASDELRRLPFAVTHQPSSGGDLDGTPRPLVSARVRLCAPGAAASAERARLMALEMVPDLLAVVEDDAVVLSCWLSGGHDLARLAQVLSTWGVAVHARLGIVDVSVVWWSGGPPSSL